MRAGLFDNWIRKMRPAPASRPVFHQLKIHRYERQSLLAADLLNRKRHIPDVSQRTHFESAGINFAGECHAGESTEIVLRIDQTADHDLAVLVLAALDVSELRRARVLQAEPDGGLNRGDLLRG
jgi:hypothetical protein